MSRGLSVGTIGRLISGFGEQPTSLYREAVTNPAQMARQCRITFRPLPKGYRHEPLERLRADLSEALTSSGVDVIPWDQAAVHFRQKIILPILHRPFSFTTRGVRKGIHAVIDVERPPSLGRRLGTASIELLYRLTRCLSRNNRKRSLPSIARLTMWGDDHAVKYLQDHVNTQIVTLMEFDRDLVDHELPYRKRIGLGLAALAETFSQIVVGLHDGKISVLNMNLTDSVVDRADLDRFVRHCLVPKLFVPVTPLLPGQFEVGQYDPQTTASARELLRLGDGLRSTGLLPQGQRLCKLLKRKSRRDMVEMIMDGRTGVSFGFIAFIEPPRYVGPRQLDESQWRKASPTTAYDPEEIRRGPNDRLFARIQIAGDIAYRQIPDVWMASSRSGCDKTSLRLDEDIIRIGYDGAFHVHRPAGFPADSDLNPSYDLRVMAALALATALYKPEMLTDGAPLFHFHGYADPGWFQADEAFIGSENPAVPCGTTEAGVFNFQMIAHLVQRYAGVPKLVGIIEPDHGTNFLARHGDYLLQRVHQGIAQGQLVLGGKHLARLREVERMAASNSGKRRGPSSAPDPTSALT